LITLKSSKNPFIDPVLLNMTCQIPISMPIVVCQDVSIVIHSAFKEGFQIFKGMDGFYPTKDTSFSEVLCSTPHNYVLKGQKIINNIYIPYRKCSFLGFAQNGEETSCKYKRGDHNPTENFWRRGNIVVDCTPDLSQRILESNIIQNSPYVSV